MAKKASKKVTTSTSKIAEIANQLLTLDGLNDLEVNEIHLTTREGVAVRNIVCRWIINDLGEWELVCTEG